jgi:hypothetical protein
VLLVAIAFHGAGRRGLALSQQIGGGVRRILIRWRCGSSRSTSRRTVFASRLSRYGGACSPHVWLAIAVWHTGTAIGLPLRDVACTRWDSASSSA